MVVSYSNQIVICSFWHTPKHSCISQDANATASKTYCFPSCLVWISIFRTASELGLLRNVTREALHSPLRERVHTETSGTPPWAGHSSPARTAVAASPAESVRVTPAAHVANAFDFRSKERRNQCVQRIARCLANRFVFPVADFEVSGTDTLHNARLPPKAIFPEGKRERPFPETSRGAMGEARLTETGLSTRRSLFHLYWKLD